jgi:hypothetical protein
MVVWDPDLEMGGLAVDQIKRAKILLWKGHCSVHQMFQKSHIDAFRAKYPDGLVIAHPECNFEVCAASDYVGSTEHIVRTIREAPAGTRWLVGTELNLVDRLAREVLPQNKIVQFMATTVCMCSTMQRIDPQHLAWTLENLADGTIVNQIKVPEHEREILASYEPFTRAEFTARSVVTATPVVETAKGTPSVVTIKRATAKVPPAAEYPVRLAFTVMVGCVVPVRVIGENHDRFGTVSSYRVEELTEARLDSPAATMIADGNSVPARATVPVNGVFESPTEYLMARERDVKLAVYPLTVNSLAVGMSVTAYDRWGSGDASGTPRGAMVSSINNGRTDGRTVTITFTDGKASKSAERYYSPEELCRGILYTNPVNPSLVYTSARETFLRVCASIGDSLTDERFDAFCEAMVTAFASVDVTPAVASYIDVERASVTTVDA